MAGVSEGTVDRVLHNRGEVSAKSKARVLEVLEEINYTPNLLARSLASKKHFHFLCIIPTYQPGEYWEFVKSAFSQAGQDYQNYNIHLETRYYNQYDILSFREIMKEALSLNSDAVILAPVFGNDSLQFIKELKKRGIPFSLIDSLLEDSGYLSYYGQNSFQSGYVAARLLLSDLPEGGKVLIQRTRRQGDISNQTKLRFDGFMKYFSEFHSGRIELVLIEFSDEDDAESLETIAQAFNEHPQITAGITFTSKVYKLAEFIQQIGQSSIRLLGYDLLDRNVDCLRQEEVSYLIAQSPGKQAYYTVRDLCNQLILKQEINRTNFVPIDILIRENIDDYLLFRDKY